MSRPPLCWRCFGIGRHARLNAFDDIETITCLTCNGCGRCALPERVYIAGPMTGYADLNFPAFNAKAAKLRALGYVVINPAEINDENPADALTMTSEELAAHWQKCMRADITALLTCDRIVMLDGWTRSRGATLEHHVAKALGMPVSEAG